MYGNATSVHIACTEDVMKHNYVVSGSYQMSTFTNRVFNMKRVSSKPLSSKIPTLKLPMSKKPSPPMLTSLFLTETKAPL